MTILRVRSGADKGKTYEITGESTTIGREEDCAIQIPDPTLRKVINYT